MSKIEQSPGGSNSAGESNIFKDKLSHLCAQFSISGVVRAMSPAHLVFWIGMPIAWALPTIYYNVNLAPEEASPLSEIFTVIHLFIIWVCCYAATRLVARLTRSRPMLPGLVFALGGLIGVLFFARPVLRASVTLRAEWLASSEKVSRQILEAIPSYFEFSPDFMLTLVSIYWFRIFCWVASAWFFYSFFAKPSFGLDTSKFTPLDKAITHDADVSNASTASTPPHFLSKVNSNIGKDVVALKAEGHYVRVYTRVGNDLIYYRFSDAVAQLGGEIGTQVHRSYWVNAKAAKAVKDTSGKFELLLPNDLKIPIGQTYKQNVRAQGLIP